VTRVDAEPWAELASAGLVANGAEPRLTEAGRAAMADVDRARREGLAELLDGLEPDEHRELRELLDRTAHEFASAPPSR
jgi:hypothetical protein